MNEYKMLGETIEDGVFKYDGGVYISFDGGRYWKQYQAYVANGGLTDPWQDKDEAESDALVRLWQYHDRLVAESDAAEYTKPSKVSKSLRKEAKGTQSADDVKILDDNDIVDDWLDDLERDAEDQGETWIEDPIRITEELQAFDPATDIVWTVFPDIGGSDGI